MSESRSALDIVRTRAMIEAHIERCRDSAAANLIEIGRWLNRAKAEGVVPHGEWTAWVQEHAGMTERTAQRMMQAARELPVGSPLERLGMTKLSALLTLPPSEREEAAQAMDAEHLSSRQVSDRVAALKRERDEALRLIGEQKKSIEQLRAEKSKAVSEAAREAAAQARRAARVEMRAENDLLTEQYNDICRREQEMQKALAKERSNASDYKRRRALMEKEMEELREDLAAARSAADMSPQARAKMDSLQKQLEEREREIDRLTDRLDEAQTALMRGGMGAGERIAPSMRILSAIGALMAEAGNAPGELARMHGTMDVETRQLLVGQAQMLGQWAMRIIAVCGGGTDGDA